MVPFLITITAGNTAQTLNALRRILLQCWESLVTGKLIKYTTFESRMIGTSASSPTNVQTARILPMLNMHGSTV